MPVAVYDSDLTVTNGGELTDASTVGNWSESSDGGWDDGGSMVAETNFYIQGIECISAQFTKTGVGSIIWVGTTFTVDTDGAILIWHFWASPSSLTTYASGGVRTLVGNSLGDFYAFKASGSDFEPNPFGGWYNYAVNPDVAVIDTTVGAPTGVWTHVGMAVNATAQSRGNPNAVDAIRVGRCTIEVTNGQAGSYGTFAGMASFDNSSGERYAVFQSVVGGYRWQGLMSLGLTGTLVDFRDSNANIVIANTPMVSVNFNKIEIHNAASNVEWTSINILAYGINDPIAATASAGKFEMIDNATVIFITCTFTDMLTFIFLSNAVLTSNTWIGCGQITHGGATFESCSFSAYEGTVSTGYLIYNVAVDPDGELDDCSFSKGTAATHAIQFGILTPLTITLRGIDFTGYIATHEQNDSTLLFPDTGANVTWTVNLIGCTGNISYKKTRVGDTVVLVSDPVVTKITVLDNDNKLPIVGAAVYVTADAGGPLTEGIVIIDGETDSNGEITDSRTLASDQPIIGVARSGSAEIPYVDGDIVGSIDSLLGLSTTVILNTD